MNHRFISSLKNPQIKKLLKLRIAQKMTAMGCFCVEGAREINQARYKFKMLELYLQKEALSPAAKKIVAESKQAIHYPLAPYIFQKVAVRENKDGILAVFSSKYFSLADLSLSANPLLVVCQELQKPGNLGAMIRTTLAVGSDALIIVEQKMNLYNPNVIRASLGYVFNAPIAGASSAEVFNFLQEKNIHIVLADGAKTGTIYTTYDFTKPTAVVFGSEAEGLSQFWRDKNITRLYVPMHAPVDSLNVSVCGGIILYEAWRQRNKANS